MAREPDSIHSGRQNRPRKGKSRGKPALLTVPARPNSTLQTNPESSMASANGLKEEAKSLLNRRS